MQKHESEFVSNIIISPGETPPNLIVSSLPAVNAALGERMVSLPVSG
jgi:hypothetical protein